MEGCLYIFGLVFASEWQYGGGGGWIQLVLVLLLRLVGWCSCASSSMCFFGRPRFLLLLRLIGWCSCSSSSMCFFGCPRCLLLFVPVLPVLLSFLAFFLAGEAESLPASAASIAFRASCSSSLTFHSCRIAPRMSSTSLSQCFLSNSWSWAKFWVVSKWMWWVPSQRLRSSWSRCSRDVLAWFFTDACSCGGWSTGAWFDLPECYLGGSIYVGIRSRNLHSYTGYYRQLR